jgi:hypothetical protein
MITRANRWFDTVTSTHDNALSFAKSKVRFMCAVPSGRIILNGISTLVYTSGTN